MIRPMKSISTLFYLLFGATFLNATHPEFSPEKSISSMQETHAINFVSSLSGERLCRLELAARDADRVLEALRRISEQPKNPEYGVTSIEEGVETKVELVFTDLPADVIMAMMAKLESTPVAGMYNLSLTKSGGGPRTSGTKYS